MHKLSGIALRALRGEYFEKVKKEFNVSDEEIANLLLDAGFQGFSQEEIPQYDVAIKSHFGHKELVKKEESKPLVKQGDWKSKVFIRKETFPCPIPGCEGIKQFSGWGTSYWKCSWAGSKHYWAIKVGKLWAGPDATHEQMLEKAELLINSIRENNSGKEKEENKDKVSEKEKQSYP